MFEITITGKTMDELAANALALAAQFQTTAPEAGDAAPAPRRAAPKPRAVEPEADVQQPADDTDRELLAEVPPAPNTANAVVDAGTGQPIAATAEVVQLTMSDVKAAAAKLAAKDTPALAALLAKYDAPNLSGIAPEKLPDFVAEVMAKLEA